MTHIPVLLKEMLLHLSPQNGGVYVDATFGAGGYSKAILESADCKVYAIDRDETVIKFYNNLNAKYSGKIKLFIEKFSNIQTILNSSNLERCAEPSIILKSPYNASARIEKKNVWSSNRIIQSNVVDGIVFDIGVSSMQLNKGSRGFSFLHNGPLDMRMDSSSYINASTFVNTLHEEEIANTIYNYGGERCSRKIARAIVNARKKKLSTLHLSLQILYVLWYFAEKVRLILQLRHSKQSEYG